MQQLSETSAKPFHLRPSLGQSVHTGSASLTPVLVVLYITCSGLYPSTLRTADTWHKRAEILLPLFSLLFIPHFQSDAGTAFLAYLLLFAFVPSPYEISELFTALISILFWWGELLSLSCKLKQVPETHTFVCMEIASAFS